MAKPALSTNKYEYIDSLRGIAIIMVILRHASQSFQNDLDSPLLLYFLNFGELGVQLFFIVSAYTLLMSERAKKGENNWTNFYIKRIARVLPLFIIGIVYFTWQEGGMHQRTWGNEVYEINIFTLLSNALLIHGSSPYTINAVVPGSWSIAAEFFFYLLFPLLFMKFKNINKLLIALSASILIAITLQISLQNIDLIPQKKLWNAYLYFYFPRQLPAFIVGLILYYYIIEKQRQISAYLFIFALILTSVFAIIKNDYNFAIFTAIIFPVLIYLAEKYQFKLKSSLLAYIGKISYSMYFIHFATIYWLMRLGFYRLLDFPGIISFLLLFMTIIVCAIFASTISYHFIELPFIRLGKKISSFVTKK